VEFHFGESPLLTSSRTVSSRPVPHPTPLNPEELPTFFLNKKQKQERRDKQQLADVEKYKESVRIDERIAFLCHR